MPDVADAEGMSKDMVLRKLQKEEHGKTRRLWEQIFTEDTPKFLDYYYSVKTKENEIYVIEEDGAIRSMLHLNPYKMQIGCKTVESHYIVAVATEETYRKRGYMAKLLKKAMEDMRENGEAFTFLMPAAEAIYYPHGFRFIYRQEQREVSGKKMEDPKITVASATLEVCGELADFANRMLKLRHQVYTLRDFNYYRRLLEEFRSEDGGMLLVRENEKLVGFFGYGKDEKYEILEPLFQNGYGEALLHAIYTLTGDEHTTVHCAGIEESENTRKKPMIMAKILDIPKMFACMEAKEEMSLSVRVTDEPGKESLGTFYIRGKEGLEVQQSDLEKEPVMRAASFDAEETISIGDLTSILFGYGDLKEMNLTEHLEEELGKIKPMSKVLLNEVV